MEIDYTNYVVLKLERDDVPEDLEKYRNIGVEGRILVFVPYDDPILEKYSFEKRKRGTLKSPPFGRNGIYDMMSKETQGIIDTDQYLNESGRFPANLLVENNVLDMGLKTSKGHNPNLKTTGYGKFGGGSSERVDYKEDTYIDDAGDFSRYFSLDAWYSKNIEELPDYVQRIFPFLYVPKASSGERNENLKGKPEQKWLKGGGGTGISARENIKAKNIHPTVKPLKLMSYLVTIGSRPGDTILDPFMGSGTTGVAAKILHRDFIGFEIERKYFEIAQQRIENKAACKDILSYPYEERESIKETGEKK